MRRSFCVALLLSFLAAASARGGNRTWINTAGGSSGSWTDGSLWIPSGVPQPDDDIRITEGGTYSCTTGANFTIRTLTMGGSSGQKTVEVTAGTTLTLGFTSNINDGSTLVVRGAVANGEVNVNGGMVLEDGSKVTGPSTLYVNTNGFLSSYVSEIRGRRLEVFNGDLEVQGTLTLSEGAMVSNDGTMTVFSNIARGSGAAGSIENKDLLSFSGSSVSVGVDVNNSANVDLGFGTVTLTGESTYTQTSGTTTMKGANLAGPVVLSGGTLTGTGTLGPTTNGGTILLAAPTTTGALTVQGPFSQLPTGVLQIKIGGASLFDRLVIRDLASLGGQISLVFLNGFVPADGMQFPIITYGSWNQVPFAIQNGFQLGNVTLKPVYSGTGVTLVAQLASNVCGTDSLCLLSDRFDVSLTARDPRLGTTGAGVPTQQNDLFGYFTIPALTNDTKNPEVIVKMLDGTPVNQKYWVFYGGLTDFEYTLTIFDRVTGMTRTYTKPGFEFGGNADTSAFGKRLSGGPLEPWLGIAALDTLAGIETLDDPPVSSGEAGCITTSDALCVLAGRFRIRLSATDPRTGATGDGVAIAQNDLYGYFSVPALTGKPGNVEVAVKMLDARSVNGKFWVFYGGLTDFEYTLTVTDTTKNVTKSYTKPGRVFSGGADTGAF